MLKPCGCGRTTAAGVETPRQRVGDVGSQVGKCGIRLLATAKRANETNRGLVGPGDEAHVALIPPSRREPPEAIFLPVAQQRGEAQQRDDTQRRCVCNQGRPQLLELLTRQGLSEQVRHLVLGIDFAHHHMPVRLTLPQCVVRQVNMLAPGHDQRVPRELYAPVVVLEDRGWLRLGETHLLHEHTLPHDIGGAYLC